MAFEYASKGNLVSFLRKHVFHSAIEKFKWQLKIAENIASGLDYLHARKVIHRDLAARNILVCDRRHVTIGDFGLSCEVEGIIPNLDALPIRWSAPEVLENFMYSYASDIWSFGVVLLELFTDGEEPWSNYSVPALFHAIKSGKQLEVPEKRCPPEICQLMQGCWKFNPQDRNPLVSSMKILKDLDTQYRVQSPMQSPIQRP